LARVFPVMTCTWIETTTYSRCSLEFALVGKNDLCPVMWYTLATSMPDVCIHEPSTSSKYQVWCWRLADVWPNHRISLIMSHQLLSGSSGSDHAGFQVPPDFTRTMIHGTGTSIQVANPKSCLAFVAFFISGLAV
jgi:hypothetical protein